MGAFDRFDTIAEIAITLAGFSALVMAFRSRGGLDVEGLRRITYIVVASFVVAISAFLPTSLGAFGFSIAAGIRFTIFLLGVASLAVAINGVMAWINGIANPVFPKSTVVLMVTVFSSSVMLLLGSANFWLSPSSELLLTGQIVLLSLAGWTFLSTIIWTSAKDSNNDA